MCSTWVLDQLTLSEHSDLLDRIGFGPCILISSDSVFVGLVLHTNGANDRGSTMDLCRLVLGVEAALPF